MIKTSNSRWKDRQDNKAYMVAYATMLWGLMVGDDLAVQEAVNVYKLAINDMRADGSWPIDSQRSGMGLKYGADSTGYLVMMAALLKNATGQDLTAYTVEERALDDAVDFVVQGIKKPAETNAKYAIGCKEGGDRWGSADKPSVGYRSKATYLEVYYALTPAGRGNAWSKSQFNTTRRTSLEVFGAPAACLFDIGEN